MNFYQISVVVFAIVLAVAVLIYSYKFYFWSFAKKPQKVLKTAKQDKRYAILIPAKDESAVIRELLESIQKQTYNKNNLQTFVIVADKDDPTIEICKEFENTRCHCLTKKVNSKGATLKEMISVLWQEGQRFDGYFIIDADNVLFDDFVEKMNDALCAGNDVVLGARVNKCPSSNWVEAGSTLTWTYLNAFGNKCRSAKGQNINIQGSPLLISKTIIEDAWKGEYPLTSLTEDVELAYYCILNNFKSFYYEYAVAYDEQPHNYKQSVNQRVRWLKGYTTICNKYRSKTIKTKCKNLKGIFKFDTVCSIVCLAFVIASLLVFCVYSAVTSIVFACLHNPIFLDALIGFGASLLFFYMIMVAYTGFGVWVEDEKLRLTLREKIKICFTVPLFYVTYLPIFIKSLVKKNIKWTKVAHTKKCEK